MAPGLKRKSRSEQTTIASRLVMFVLIILLSATWIQKSRASEIYQLRVGSQRLLNGKLNNKLILGESQLVVLCDLVDLNLDSTERSHTLYQQFSLLGHRPSMTISNNTWRETFQLQDNAPMKEWKVLIMRKDINPTEVSVGKWKVKIELFRDTGLYQTSASLLDIGTEPIFRWSLGEPVQNITSSQLISNVSGVIITQSSCSPDITIAFIITTSNNHGAFVGVSYCTFQPEYTQWYDMFPSLCQLNPSECTGVQFIDAQLTMNHLFLLTSNGIYVSDALTMYNTSMQVLPFTKIELPGVNADSNHHFKVWYVRQCHMEFGHDRLHRDEYMSLVVSTPESDSQAFVSIAPHRVWFSVTMLIEGRIIATLYDNKKNNMIVLKTNQLNNVARVVVYNSGSLVGTKTRANKFRTENQCFPEWVFPETFHALGILQHPHYYALYVYGSQVWVSIDGGNMFSKLLDLAGQESIVAWTTPQYQETVLFTTNMGRVYYGKAGVQRLTLLSTSKLNDVPGIIVDHLGSIYQIEWNSEQRQSQVEQLNVQSSIQEHQAMYDHMLAVQPFTATEVFLLEYTGDDVGNTTGIFTKSNTWQTVTFSPVGKVLILSVEVLPATAVFRTSVKAYVIEQLQHEQVHQTIGITPLFNDTVMVVILYETNFVWSMEDIGKTLVVLRQPGILLTSIINDTNIIGESIVQMASQSSLQAKQWYLYDPGTNWSISEDDCQHILIPDDTVYKYPIRYLDIGDNFTFAVSAARMGKVLPDSKPLMYATVSSPHLIRVMSKVTVNRYGYETLTLTAIHQVYGMGTATITVHLWQSSLKCAKSSFSVTVYCSCPPQKSLRFVYPYVITFEDYLHGSPKDRRDKPLLYNLEVNYRAPSKHGVAIPISEHVYNVDPSKPIPNNMFRISQQSWKFKQCAGKETREDCNCTDIMKVSNLAKYSDCKERVYRVWHSSSKLPLKFYIHDGDTQTLLTSPYVLTVTEVNGRQNFFISNTTTKSFDALLEDERFEHRSQYLHPTKSTIVVQGSGLYHFKAKVIPGYSYCPLEDEFQVFIDDAILPYPLQMIIIVSISIVIGGLLFAIYLWYLHNHHTHRIKKIGSRCQQLH